ncbi:MAG: hypothetical protein ACYDHY_17375 [Acidiferrobacterales bacterium]
MSKSNKSAPVTVSVTTAATLILAANGSRVVANIANVSTQTVYLGRDNTVTTANGWPLGAGSNMEDRETTDAWYGIVAVGTADVRPLEAS